MAIQKRWSKFTKTNVSKVPQEEGAYQLGYAYGGKKIGYIGSSNNLHKRLLHHLSDPAKAKYPYFRYILADWGETGTELEAWLVKGWQKSQKPKLPKGMKQAPKKKSLW